MDFNELHLENAASQMVPKVEGNVIVVRSVQPVKALSYMSVTPSCKVSDFSPVQYENVLPSITFTPDGMTIEVRLPQPKKAPPCILVSPAGRVIDANL